MIMVPRAFPSARTAVFALAGAFTVAAIMEWSDPTHADPLVTMSKKIATIEAVKLIRAAAPRIKDAEGWAYDLLYVFRSLRIETTRENVCSAIAIIAQESGFEADPAVPGIGAMAEKAAQDEITKSLKLRTYFSFYPDVKNRLLERLRAAKTERDLDLAYRWLSGVLLEQKGVPMLIQALNQNKTLAQFFEEHNRVRTIGSMQVSVSFAISASSKKNPKDLTIDDAYAVRDFLYTRRGGLQFGVLQLLGYRAGYSAKIYVFADYNSGRYSSRNAAVQQMVSSLTETNLALDGDLLAYAGRIPLDKKGDTETQIGRLGPRLGLDEMQIRTDLLREKDASFVQTATYKKIVALYERDKRKKAPYAIVPQITLNSIKVSTNMTTARFAAAVDRRYQQCLHVVLPELMAWKDLASDQAGR